MVHDCRDRVGLHMLNDMTLREEHIGAMCEQCKQPKQSRSERAANEDRGQKEKQCGSPHYYQREEWTMRACLQDQAWQDHRDKWGKNVMG